MNFAIMNFPPISKVIIEKSRCEVAPFEQDISQLTKKFKKYISYNFLIFTSKYDAKHVISYEVYYGLIGEKILKLSSQESWPFGPNPAKISILFHKNLPPWDFSIMTLPISEILCVKNERAIVVCGFLTQYMTNLTIVSQVKMEYG